MATARRRKLRKKKSGLILPTKTKGIDFTGVFKMLLYGPEGIGKSTFCSQLKDALFIPTESGLGFLDVLEEPCEDWAKFRDIIAAAVEVPDQYAGFIIDTADNAYDQCQVACCEALGIEHPSDEEWGKGYQVIRLAFYAELNKLAQTGRPLILTSHEKSVEVKGRIIKTSKTVPTLSNTARRVILPMVDLIGHCGFKTDRTGEATTRRIITFEPTETQEAKDRSGVMPRHIPLNYKAFHTALMADPKKKSKVGPKRGPKRGR